jgi:hypothetical protein
LYNGVTIVQGLPATYVSDAYLNPVVLGGGETWKGRGGVKGEVGDVGSSRDGNRWKQMNNKLNATVLLQPTLCHVSCTVFKATRDPLCAAHYTPRIQNDHIVPPSPFAFRIISCKLEMYK